MAKSGSRCSRNRPFFELLTVSGAARVADYNSGAGTVWAYNGNIEWAPVRDIRFRANYSRSVRAPALAETAFPLTQNFAPNFIDPCAPSVRGATANRANNCATALGANLANIPDVVQVAPDPEREQSEPQVGSLGLLDLRRGHPAALDPGPVVHGGLLQHPGEQRHRDAHRPVDRQQLLRSAGL